MRGMTDRDRMYVAVDILILTVCRGRLRLLLSRRTGPPCEGRWALPGGAVSPGDSAETAARRLTEALLPVPNPYLEQLYTFTEPDRDPRGRVISIAYLMPVPWARLQPALETGVSAPETGVSALRGFDVRMDAGALRLEGEAGVALGADDLAFDHGRIIRTGLQRLRGKIDYTDIGFRFLGDPGAFSLGELQEVFEAVLDKSVDGSNFRRAIQSRYEESGRMIQIDRGDTARRKRGRPAAMYRMAFAGETSPDAR